MGINYKIPQRNVWKQCWGFIKSGLALLLIGYVACYSWNYTMEDFAVDRRMLVDYGAKRICNLQSSVERKWEKNDKIIRSLDNNIKVFQIGFNKCGTRTLCSMFSRSKLPCLHLRLHKKYNCLNNWVIDSHAQSLQSGTLDIWKMLPHYIMFADFGIVAKSDINGIYLPNYLSINLLNKNQNVNQTNRSDNYINIEYNFDESLFWYKQFEKRLNKTSLYILNIRPVHNWLKSRSVHKNDIKETLIFRVQRKYHFRYNEIEILIMWRNLWYVYICNVINYFNSINATNRLLIFDIESDDPHILYTFFENFGFNLKNNKYNQHGKSHVHYNAKILQWIEIEKSKWPWLNQNNEKNAIESICQVKLGPNN